MMRLSEIFAGPDGSSEALGTVTSLREGYWEAGRENAPQVVIEDCSGRCSLLVPTNLVSLLGELEVGSIIRFAADFKGHVAWLGGWIRGWEVIKTEDLLNVAGVQAISRCPESARASLLALADAVDEMTVPAVRDAVNGVLSVSMPELLKAGASWEHHHCEPGGLLSHTVEVALLARDEAGECFPDEPWRVEVVFLLAIIHDVAKAHVQRADRGNAFVRAAWHQLGSMVIASPALIRLGEAHPPAGAVAGTALRWLLLGKQYRRDSHCPEGEIVRQADMTSARRYNCRKSAANHAANDDRFDVAVNQ